MGNKIRRYDSVTVRISPEYKLKLEEVAAGMGVGKSTVIKAGLRLIFESVYGRDGQLLYGKNKHDSQRGLRD